MRATTTKNILKAGSKIIHRPKSHNLSLNNQKEIKGSLNDGNYFLKWYRVVVIDRSILKISWAMVITWNSGSQRHNIRFFICFHSAGFFRNLLCAVKICFLFWLSSWRGGFLHGKVGLFIPFTGCCIILRDDWRISF